MSKGTNWNMFGSKVPKEEIVYFCQITIVYTVIITSIINLSFKTGQPELWITLLSSGIGYLMPNPRLGENGKFLPHPAEQRIPSPVPEELTEFLQNQSG